MIASLILCTAYSSLFIWLIHKSSFFREENLSRGLPLAFFLMKLLMGATIAALYTFYYTDRASADIYKYFDDSKVLYDCLIHHPGTFIDILLDQNLHDPKTMSYELQMMHWNLGHHRLFENGHRGMILFNTFCRFLSGGHFIVHVVLINILSFLGLFAWFKAMKQLIPLKPNWLICFVYLVPSVLFWGSGLLKEGLLLLGLGFAMLGFQRLMFKEKAATATIMMMLGMMLLAYIKVHVLLTMLPFLVVLFIIREYASKYALLGFASMCFLLIATVLLVPMLVPSFHPTDALLEKMHSFQQLTGEAKAGSNYVLSTDSSNDISGLIKLIPSAWAVSALRPFPWEIHGIFTILPLLENMLFFMLLLFFLLKLWRNKSEVTHRDQLLALLYFFLCFCTVQFILCGLVSFNFGALSRYRMPGFLCWYMIIAIIAGMGMKKVR